MPVGTVPASNDVLPAEAQRVIDRATATAGAVATGLYHSQATAQADRVTATAVALETRASLGVQQTQVALQVIQAAIHAQETQSAIDHEQAALVVTITAEAARIKAIQGELALEERRNRIASWEAFWMSAGDTVIFLAWIAGLTAIVYIFLTLALVAWSRYLQMRAFVAREAFKVLPPNHYADYDPRSGYTVNVMPRLTDGQDQAIIEVLPKATNWNSGWRRAYRLHAFWGDRFGFSLSALVTFARVESDPAWRKLNAAFVAKNLIGDTLIEKDGRRVRATGWVGNWNLAKFVEEYAAGRLVLPLPSGEDPPTVADTLPPQQDSVVAHNTTP